MSRRASEKVYLKMRMGSATHRGFRLSADPRLADFQTFRLGRRIVYLRHDVAARAPTILASIRTISAEAGAGNRSSGVPLRLEDGTELFVRIGRRGGLIGLVFKDFFVGVRARPARELAVASEARRRGIPVAEPIGAIVEWVAPVIYRSMFLTRALPGMTLWEFLRTDDDSLVRRHVIKLARNSIDTMHRMGLFHADLNLHNLLVTKAHESFAVAILDLDKARFLQSPLPEAIRGRNLARLRRSALKLDPGQHCLDSRLLRLLTGIPGGT